jgi:hypothetical protein
MNFRKPILALTFSLALAGCTSEKPAEPTGPTPAAGPVTAVDVAGGGAITGKVTFSDGKPRRAQLRMDADAACAAMHKEPVYSEDIVLNDNGTVRYAFVFVSKGLEGKSFTTPSQSVELDQKGCLYTPRVVAVMTNQELRIKNGDQTTHNIHPVPKNNREWNRSQPPGAEDIVERFPREEVLIPVKCNIHPWMRAYIAVLNHPFYAVTGADGSFSIKGLPPGSYTVTAWTEKYGNLEQQVTVAAKETKTVDFTVKPGGGAAD